LFVEHPEHLIARSCQIRNLRALRVFMVSERCPRRID